MTTDHEQKDTEKDEKKDVSRGKNTDTNTTKKESTSGMNSMGAQQDKTQTEIYKKRILDKDVRNTLRDILLNNVAAARCRVKVIDTIEAEEKKLATLSVIIQSDKNRLNEVTKDDEVVKSILDNADYIPYQYRVADDNLNVFFEYSTVTNLAQAQAEALRARQVEAAQARATKVGKEMVEELEGKKEDEGYQPTAVDMANLTPFIEKERRQLDKERAQEKKSKKN